MTGDPICPKCGKPMEVGFVLDKAHGNIKETSKWIAGKPEPGFWLGVKTRDRSNYEIRTFRCSGCGYLESYAPK